MAEPQGAGSDGRVSTGIRGLDEVLGGGLPGHRLYLVQGDPGSGKTTLALQFLLAGAERGERGLYVALSETAEELSASAASHGWTLDGVTVFDLPAGDAAGTSAQTLFHPSEIELSETTRAVTDVVERARPSRVVFDSLSEMRLLARDPLRYRRQILALKQFFIGRGCTVLLLDDRTSAETDLHLQSVAHGVISMEQLAPVYGPERRRLRITKMRGIPFAGGHHDMRILTGGIVVYPRLVTAEAPAGSVISSISSGLPSLDALLGGGIDRGTSTLILGPAGTGKTSLALHFAVAAAAAGEAAAIYLFEESAHTYRARAAGLGVPLEAHLASGRIRLRQVNPAEMTPGELARDVSDQVRGGARVAVLDTLNGYLNAMPEERYLLLHLHDLLSHLGQQGVATILVEAQQGAFSLSPEQLQVSFLADTVVLLRHFESAGSVRQAISVLKKRTGPHERTIRELVLAPQGVRVGEPLTEFRGLLTGVPVHVGREAALLGRDREPPEP